MTIKPNDNRLERSGSMVGATFESPADTQPPVEYPTALLM